MKKLLSEKIFAAIVSLIPVIIIMGIIFSFSSQTAQASTVTSGGFVAKVMEFISRNFGEISEDAYESVEHTVTIIVRKSAHFLEFAALGFFLEIHFRTFLEKKTWLFSLAVSVLYACSDEFHQRFVSERAPRFTDVMVDSSGAICAIIFVCLFVFIFRKMRKRGEAK